MENKKNIIWLTTQFPEGEKNRSGMFIYRTVKELTKHYPITVICLCPTTPPIIPMIKNWKNYKEIFKEWKKLHSNKPVKPKQAGQLNVIYVRYLRPPRGKFSFLEGYVAYRSIKKYIDELFKDKNILFHANWLFPAGKTAELLAKKFNSPYIITLRGSDVNSLNRNSWNYKSAKSTLKNSNEITSVSEKLLDRGRNMNLLDNNYTKKITHNFYETNKFIIKDKEKSRKFLGVAIKAKVVFFAGNLTKNKNVDLLIKSLYKLNLEKNYMQLYIAGSGYEEDFLNNLISERKIFDYVTFLGNIEPQKLIEYYNAADVFCLVSKNEGLPNVIVESLLCGTPVVATQVGEIPSLIKEGINGYLVTPNSVSSLSEKILKSLKTNWDRNIVRNSVSFLFPENVINEYKNLYREFGFDFENK